MECAALVDVCALAGYIASDDARLAKQLLFRQDKQGKVLPVLITVYGDKSFDFIIKTPPAAVQLKDAAKIQSGSKEPNRNKVGKVSWAQVEEIAKDKMADLNAFSLNSAMKMIAGTARSMGLTVDGTAPWEN